MKATVGSKEFKRILKALKPFTSQDHMNDKMQYIYLEINNGEIRLEALDGHRIAIEYIECVNDENFTAYIKPVTLFKTSSEEIIIEVIGDKAYVTDNEFSFGFKQPDGEWYDTKTMISDYTSKTPQVAIGVNPKLLIDALKDIKKSGSREIVEIEIYDKASPVIIRNVKDKRDIRLVLPIKINV